MKILVTGSAGFIGFSLCLFLLKKKNKVIGIDNLNNYYDISLKKKRLNILKKFKNFEFHKLDLSNKNDLLKKLKRKNFSYVVHLAAQAGVRHSLMNPEEYTKSNLVGFANILELIRSKKIKHFLFASTSSVYGLSKSKSLSEEFPATYPIQYYAATKRANELMAHSYSYLFKIPSTALRFFTVYGPWGRPDMALFKFTRNILLNKPIEVFNHGKHKRDFTYIDDVVRSIYLTINKIPKKGSTNSLSNSQVAPFSILNIGGGKKVSLMKFIKEIENCLGLKAKIKYLPLQPGDVIKTSCNTNKIKSYLKFLPKTDYKQGIKNFVFWYKTFLK